MDQSRLLAIANRFALPAAATAVEPLGNGNINDTYLVHTASGERAVLQRINTRVFERPDLVMANLAVLTAHASAQAAQQNTQQGAQQEDQGWQLPRPIACGRQGPVPPAAAAEGPACPTWLEERGEVWRMLSYVAGCVSHDTVQSLDHAREVGRALGRFHHLVADLPGERLHDTLEGFHVTPRYLEHYRRVQADTTLPPCPESSWCRRFVEQRLDLVPVLEQAREAGRLQLRAIHGDPKVNNVMVSATNGRAVALVDLDTVKPGLLHTDIGDCLRSACNPAGEETTDLEAVQFDLELAGALLGGYLEEARSCLSPCDLDLLYDAIRLLPFELGLRFFTDHLAGNVYFKASHPRHNLERALVQFRLTESIEAQAGEIRRLIQQLSCR